MTTHQVWDPAQYARNAAFVPQLGAGVLGLLAAQPGERILDLGCGDGVLTEQLAALGCEVVGVDAGAAQVAAARQRGLSALVMDGERLEFEAEFDAVFSNAALHWMRNPDAVLAGVWRALRPGGRFVAELGGCGCVATIRRELTDALQRRGIDAAQWDPWYFPRDDEYAAKLAHAGFLVRSIALFPRPTQLPTAIEGWLETFAQSFLAALPPDERPALIAELNAELRPQLRDTHGQWWADYVRLRLHADKPR
jgi:SAM-dependent methyltransferase